MKLSIKHRTAVLASGLATLFVLAAAVTGLADEQADQLPPPNILWLTSEDNGPQLGCYGDTYATTPHIDQLAARSLRYRMCWSNAPVCAPARTTLISGMYATSLGGENMRSSVDLPNGMKLYPQILREAGYYCTNNSKTDYNFTQPDEAAGWNASGGKAHWKNRPDKSTPFFSVFNYTISHESKIRNQPHTLVHDPDKAPLPSYHPDTPEVRRDWAQYYDRLTQMDAQVGEALEEIEKAGLSDSTIVFYYGDHGSGMPRSKRWPFNSGLQVPLVIHVPEAYRDLAPADYMPGGMTDRLVSFVDLGPTAISLAGTQPPANMQGVPVMGRFAGKPKTHLFGYRGRMDERIDMVRSCTDGRFVYLRHFYPDRPYLKHVEYMFETPTTRIWKEMFDAGKLSEIQAQYWRDKPVEDLFDLQADPDEVNNLAGSPKHEAKLKELRGAMRQWMRSTRDLGLLTEAEMHRRAKHEAPRTYALSDNFDVDGLLSAAWRACDAWQTCDEGVIADMTGLCSSDDSGVRYWGTRGLAMGLEAHADTLSKQTFDKAAQKLADLLHDDNPSVRLAAADGLIKVEDEQLQQASAQELMRLADLPDDGYYIGIAALNVIDANRDTVRDVSGQSLDSLHRNRDDAPQRGGEYIKRLLQALRE